MRWLKRYTPVLCSLLLLVGMFKWMPRGKYPPDKHAAFEDRSEHIPIAHQDHVYKLDDHIKLSRLEFAVQTPTAPGSSNSSANKDTSNQFFTKHSNVVNSFSYNEVLRAGKLCSNLETPPLVVMLVTSAPENGAKRAFIRETWGQEGRSTQQVVTVFMLGLPKEAADIGAIVTESKTHRDVLQHDYEDSYPQLPLKTILGLDWAVKNCGRSTFVMKTDDDVVFNIPLLLERLQEMSKRRELFGAASGGSKVRRKGRWALRRDQYPFDKFVPYLSGAAYGMTMDIAQVLVHTARYVDMIPIEDVYVTGILAKVAGITPRGVAGFPAWTAKGVEKQCEFSFKRTLVGYHASSLRICRLIWTAFLKKEPCSIVKETRPQL